MNPIADNYYTGADIDDGTCIISGCTDAEACNFFAAANNEDGSCSIPGGRVRYRLRRLQRQAA